jgi:hypothetical protein
MSGVSVSHAMPSHVPSGFALRRQIDGTAAKAFRDDPEQVTLVYTRGFQRADWTAPMTVHITRLLDRELTATEGRPGTPVDLGKPGVSAVYHNGMWAMDADLAEAQGAENSLYWHTGSAHSITVRTEDHVLGIRAPRDVSFSELVKVASSLPVPA